MIVLELSSRDLGRIYSVDLLVGKFYKISLYQFCQKYGYDPLFLEILKQVTADYSYNRQSYFEIELPDELDDRYYEVEKKFSYGVDNRGVAERVVSLGVNWIVEDVIVHKSSSVFMLTGCDNARDLLANPITSTPDIRYVGTGESFYVEVCSDFTRFMSKQRRYDLRKLKYIKLEDLMLVDRVRTVLLFVDVVNKTYYRTWFHSLSYTQQDKYSKNTVSFEFDENVKFKGLEDLFELCKSCQPNPSLYSSFNVEEKKESKRRYTEDSEEEGYWQSLFESEPYYVRTRVIYEDELEGYRSLEEMMAGRDIEGFVKDEPEYHSPEFVELPSDTYTPFEMGDEPPEREYVDTSDNPFVGNYPYIDSPFSGDGLPF